MCQTECVNQSQCVISCLPWGSWWCCYRSSEVCYWGCSPVHLEQQCRLPECVGSVSPDPDGSEKETCQYNGYLLVCFIFWQKTTQKKAYLRSKYIIPVMDEDPPHPPTRDQPAFGQATARKDRNITAKRRHRRTTAAWENLKTGAQGKWNSHSVQMMWVCNSHMCSSDNTDSHKGHMPAWAFKS